MRFRRSTAATYAFDLNGPHVADAKAPQGQGQHGGPPWKMLQEHVFFGGAAPVPKQAANKHAFSRNAAQDGPGSPTEEEEEEKCQQKRNEKKASLK